MIISALLVSAAHLAFWYWVASRYEDKPKQ